MNENTAKVIKSTVASSSSIDHLRELDKHLSVQYDHAFTHYTLGMKYLTSELYEAALSKFKQVIKHGFKSNQYLDTPYASTIGLAISALFNCYLDPDLDHPQIYPFYAWGYFYLSSHIQKYQDADSYEGRALLVSTCNPFALQLSLNYLTKSNSIPNVLAIGDYIIAGNIVMKQPNLETNNRPNFLFQKAEKLLIPIGNITINGVPANECSADHLVDASRYRHAKLFENLSVAIKSGKYTMDFGPLLSSRVFSRPKLGY